MMEERIDKLRDIIRERIKETHGLNKTSEKSGVSKSQLWFWLSDGRDIRLTTLMKICDAIDLDIQIIERILE